MTITEFLTLVGTFINGLLLVAVLLQIRVASRATRSSVMLDLASGFYDDSELRKTLTQIYDSPDFIIDDSGNTHGAHGTNISISYEQVDILLNRLHLLGYMESIGALSPLDCKGLRYEIVATGRSAAIRNYLSFLNSEYQLTTQIPHLHFPGFASIYRVMEPDARQREQFDAFYNKEKMEVRSCLLHKNEEARESTPADAA